jgi:hypothetical protein
MRKPPKLRPLEERFWAKVEITSTCWVWRGGPRRRRYADITVERLGPKRWRTERINRVAWKLAYGPIPDGMYVCHKCDNPWCVRPSHLFLGTATDNMRDMAAKERGTAKLTAVDVIEIRRLYAAGNITQKNLGDRFGVNRATISYALRKTWRHVPRADAVPQEDELWSIFFG